MAAAVMGGWVTGGAEGGWAMDVAATDVVATVVAGSALTAPQPLATMLESSLQRYPTCRHHSVPRMSVAAALHCSVSRRWTSVGNPDSEPRLKVMSVTTFWTLQHMLCGHIGMTWVGCNGERRASQRQQDRGSLLSLPRKRHAKHTSIDR